MDSAGNWPEASHSNAKKKFRPSRVNASMKLINTVDGTSCQSICTSLNHLTGRIHPDSVEMCRMLMNVVHQQNQRRVLTAVARGTCLKRFLCTESRAL